MKQEKLVVYKQLGQYCESASTVTLTYCQGVCPSHDSGRVFFKSDSGLAQPRQGCKCCTGIVDHLQMFPVLCQGQVTEELVQVEVFSNCECKVCRET